MRAVVQRVTSAEVRVAGEVVGQIERGLCVLIGVTHNDGPAEAEALAAKLWHLRIVEDDAGVANLSVADTDRALLVISQFTLAGDTRKGRRPSYVAAARPEHAEPLVEAVVVELERLGATVATGRFGADMDVTLINRGPFTVTVDV